VRNLSGGRRAPFTDEEELYLPSLIPARPRPRRLLGLSPVVAALVACAVAAPASAAPPTTTFYLGLTSTDSWAEAWTNDYDATHTYTIDVLRGGAVIASSSGEYNDQNVTYPGAFLAGDVVRFTGPGQSTSVTFDGTPTMDSGACAGSRTVAGAVSPGATSLYVGSAIGSGSAGTNRATETRSGASYTALFDSPLASGATVFASQQQLLNGGNTTFYTTREAFVAASCPTPGAPSGTPATTTPTTTTTTTTTTKPSVAAQILQGLQAVLGRQGTLLAATDPTKVAKTGFVDIPFAFVTPGTVTFTWQATLLGGKPASAAAAKKQPKAKVVTIGKGTAAAASPGKGKARLKVTAAGRRLLKTAKAVQVTMSARFVPSDGTAPQQTKTKFTLRHKTKAKKKR
jgi:hypothetical protein